MKTKKIKIHDDFEGYFNDSDFLLESLREEFRLCLKSVTENTLKNLNIFLDFETPNFYAEDKEFWEDWNCEFSFQKAVDEFIEKAGNEEDFSETEIKKHFGVWIKEFNTALEKLKNFLEKNGK